ncbi:MAG: response regulator [Proteobacteria bacterium]|nr:response regulator [Pseudomonadota bacterium]
MKAELSRSSGLVAAVRMRRSQLLQRSVMACLVAVVASQVLTTGIAGVWIVTYLLAQLPELWAFDPLATGKADHQPAWRNALGFASIMLNASAFGALSIPLWLLGGAFGGACASLLNCAALINVVVGTPGSRGAAICAMLPQAVYLALTPWFMAYFGAPGSYQLAAGLGCMGFAGYALALWRMQENSRQVEKAALERADQRLKEAEAATAAKSVYVAMIGHELRTPIGAMMAGAVELERSAKGSSLRPHATLIADAGRMMKTLLDDVLDHAKLEAGRMTIETVPFDLRGMVAQTARFWQSEARKKGLRLRVEGSAGLPHWVEGDPTRIRQILNNLISNAVKFTDKGSVSLMISAWAAEDDSCSVRLQIVDTGAGMEREQLDRLFTPYQQGDKSVARNYGGTGLGLVISRQLARLMGGQLTAYSRKDEGSTFTLALTFKLAEAPAQAAEAPDAALLAPAEDQPALRVLVADDHEINRRAVQLVLKPMGADIVAVCDGKAAVEAAQAEAFDLIVMDVRMPEMDGREASRRIRAMEGPNQSTPIVAVTADTEKDDMAACRDAGMNWFVGKPIDPAALIKTVAQALEQAQEEAASSEAETFAETEAEPEDDSRPLRVLVADDHEINRRAVQLVLEPAGAHVTTVNDGKQAFEATQREAFDLIVMDVRMPEMDGQEATRRIRATSGPNQHIPIIAVTAEVDSQACFDAGMNYFVGKPIDPGRLMAAVIEAIQAAHGGEEESGEERAVA